MKPTDITRIILMISLILAATLMSIWAQAQTPGAARDLAPFYRCLQEFKAMDKNNDGNVSKEEFMSFSNQEEDPAALFKILDKNAHGYITKKEYCVDAGKKTEGH